MFKVLLVALALAASRPPAPVAVDVYPRVTLKTPASIRLRITVERDPANRSIAWAWESADFFSSDQRQLDGDAAPRVFTIFVDNLRTGSYTLVVVLGRNDGTSAQAQTTFVVGTPEEGQQ
jgi:hypothetical protein